MSRFFDPESWAWKPFGWIGDVFILSLLWVFCSFPLFTVGAATTALYDAAVHVLRRGEKDTLGRFFHTFKAEFKTSTLSTLLWAAVLGLCYLALRLYGNHVAVTDLSVVITAAGLAVLAVLVGVLCWVFPLLSRFTFGFGGLNGTAVKLALAHLPSTIVLGLVTVLAGFLCLQFLIPIFFLPCLLVLFWSLLMEPAFRQYM